MKTSGAVKARWIGRIFVTVISSMAEAAQKHISDAQINKEIVKESIAE